MAWTTAKGFNFRLNVGYVTDPSDTVFIASSDTYPTVKSIGGENVTCGWVDPPSSPTIVSANRNSGVDARLAGIHRISQSAATEIRTFRVDLDAAGDYRVTLAMGDMGASIRAARYAIYDDTTEKWSFSRTVTSKWTTGGEFRDTALLVWTSATFFANQTPTDQTFATTTFLLELGGQGTNTGTIPIAHLNIEPLSSSPEIVQPTGAALTLATNDDVDSQIIYAFDAGDSAALALGAGEPYLGGPFDPVTVTPTGNALALAAGTPTINVETPSPTEPPKPGKGHGRGRKGRREG